MSENHHLEPPDGDYVRYIDRLQSGQAPDLRPLEPPPLSASEAPSMPSPSIPSPVSTPRERPAKKRFESVLESLGATKRPQETSKEEVIARMEASANTATPTAPVPRKKKGIDPALKFISSAFAMFGCMGILIGLDSEEPAPAMFGAFAVFISAILLINGLRGESTSSLRRREPGARR